MRRRTSETAPGNHARTDEGFAGDYARRDADAERMEKDAAAQQLSALGYAKSNGLNALSFVEKIQSHGRNGQAFHLESISKPDNGLKEKYKGLIRQLPSRQYIERLVETFFREVNWHYYPLDRYVFEQQLQGWFNLSFSVLNRGPQELPADLRFFPGLLFQVLAQALQFNNAGPDSEFEALKYFKEMTLDDLASDYSDSGIDILKVLGKRECTLVTVQAGFLRTSFLKNSGNITEAWHSLSATIRDAQEIGLHKSSYPPTAHGSPEEVIEALWHTEDRRRMWVILSGWDPHMALTLGRPTILDGIYDNIVFPIDASPSLSRKTSAPTPRSEGEPPTPLTMLINQHANGAVLFREIHALEKDGPCPRTFEKVDRLHERILQNIRDMPAYFRSENPDTAFDSRPECYWLPESRPLFDTYCSFAMMCLHRPYVFTVANSRTEALKAGISILRSQRDFFQYLQAMHYKMFNLVLSTFDAIVMVAAIYIVYPLENQEYLGDALQHFEWAMERFDKMSERNDMAKQALGVLQAIHVRLVRTLELKDGKRALPSPKFPGSSVGWEQQRTASTTSLTHSQPSRASSATGSNGSAPSSAKSSHAVATNYPDYSNIQPELRSLAPPPPSMLNQTSYQSTNHGWAPQYPQPLVPGLETQNYNLGNMATLQPLHDLLFNDLVCTPDAAVPADADATAFYGNGGGNAATIPWQFEGEFKNDSFWTFMNQQFPTT